MIRYTATQGKPGAYIYYATVVCYSTYTVMWTVQIRLVLKGKGKPIGLKSIFKHCKLCSRMHCSLIVEKVFLFIVSELPTIPQCWNKEH